MSPRTAVTVGHMKAWAPVAVALVTVGISIGLMRARAEVVEADVALLKTQRTEDRSLLEEVRDYSRATFCKDNPKHANCQSVPP